MMRILCKNLNDRSDSVHHNDLEEPDEFLLVECADEPASWKIGRILHLYSLEFLAIMPEGAALAHGGLVVYALDAAHELIVEWHFLHHHTTLGGTPHILPRFLR